MEGFIFNESNDNQSPPGDFLKGIILALFIVLCLTTLNNGLQFKAIGLNINEKDEFPVYRALAYQYHSGNHYFIDGSDRVVKVLDDNGRLISTIGRVGQGPYEFEQPQNMTLRENALWVFDGYKGSVYKFGIDGKPLEDMKLTQGRTAVFHKRGILINNALGSKRFHFYDWTGKLIRSFGDGFTRTGGMHDVLRLTGECVISPDGLYLHVFYHHGGHFETYGLKTGRLLSTHTLDIFKNLTARQNKVRGQQGGTAVFTLKNGQPLKSAVQLGDHFVILAQDENEEERSLLLVLNKEGEVVRLEPTPRFFTKMIQSNHCLTFLDNTNGIIKQYILEMP